MGYHKQILFGIPQTDFVHYLILFNIEQPIILAYASNVPVWIFYVWLAVKKKLCF